MSLNKKRRTINYQPSTMVIIRCSRGFVVLAYKLELLPYSWVHLVFHVSLLKKVISDNTTVHNIFPKIDEEGEIILKHEKPLKQGLSNYGIEK